MRKKMNLRPNWRRGREEYLRATGPLGRTDQRRLRSRSAISSMDRCSRRAAWDSGRTTGLDEALLGEGMLHS
jgi:hypothetical protein